MKDMGGLPEGGDTAERPFVGYVLNGAVTRHNFSGLQTSDQNANGLPKR